MLVLAKALLFLLLIWISPVTNWDTIDNNTACAYGLLIEIWKWLANSNLLIFFSNWLIYFRNTLNVYLNLKLYKNYCIKSIHNDVNGYFLNLLNNGC